MFTWFHTNISYHALWDVCVPLGHCERNNLHITISPHSSLKRVIYCCGILHKKSAENFYSPLRSTYIIVLSVLNKISIISLTKVLTFIPLPCIANCISPIKEIIYSNTLSVSVFNKTLFFLYSWIESIDSKIIFSYNSLVSQPDKAMILI